MPGYLELDVRKIGGDGPRDAADAVAVEHYLTIQVNGMAVATLACTPENLDELVAGFLVGQGLAPLSGRAASWTFSPDRRLVKVLVRSGALSGAGGPGGGGNLGDKVPGGLVSSGCGAGLVFDQARVLMEIPKAAWDGRVRAAELLALAGALQDSRLFRLTGGTHSALAAEAATAAPDEARLRPLVRREDIGRHNAVDKVIGHLWLSGRLGASTPGSEGPGRAGAGPLALILATSGRISSDIALRAARAGFPVIVSHGAPTVMAVEIGRQLGLTLVGFARGRRLNVYSNPERVKA